MKLRIPIAQMTQPASQSNGNWAVVNNVLQVACWLKQTQLGAMSKNASALALGSSINKS